MLVMPSNAMQGAGRVMSQASRERDGRGCAVAQATRNATGGNAGRAENRQGGWYSPFVSSFAMSADNERDGLFIDQ